MGCLTLFKNKEVEQKKGCCCCPMKKPMSGSQIIDCTLIAAAYN